MAEPAERLNTYYKDDDEISGYGGPQAGLLEEWRKLLLQMVNVYVSGQNISGVLTHIKSDYIIVVGETHVHIIPLRSVVFISYRTKSEK